MIAVRGTTHSARLELVQRRFRHLDGEKRVSNPPTVVSILIQHSDEGGSRC